MFKPCIEPSFRSEDAFGHKLTSPTSIRALNSTSQVMLIPFRSLLTLFQFVLGVTVPYMNPGTSQ